MEVKKNNPLVGGLILGAALMVAALLWWSFGAAKATAILECVVIAGVMVTIFGLRYRRPGWLHRNLRSAFRLDD